MFLKRLTESDVFQKNIEFSAVANQRTGMFPLNLIHKTVKVWRLHEHDQEETKEHFHRDHYSLNIPYDKLRS